MCDPFILIFCGIHKTTVYILTGLYFFSVFTHPFQVNVKVSHLYWLVKQTFLCWNAFDILSDTGWLDFHGSVSGPSLLYHWTVCTCFCQDGVDLITVVSYLSIKSANFSLQVCSLSLLCWWFWIPIYIKSVCKHKSTSRDFYCTEFFRTPNWSIDNMFLSMNMEFCGFVSHTRLL